MGELLQFHGQVANYDVLFDNDVALDELSNGINCQPKLKSNVSPLKLNWTLAGKNIIRKETNQENICSKSDFDALTLPFEVDLLSLAKHACNVLGNGTIYAFDKPDNLTNFDFEYVFGLNFRKFSYFWTPYSDQDEEGVFRNFYTHEIEDSLHWANDNPNGGSQENFASLETSRLAFIDTTSGGGGWNGFGLTCSVPKSTITLRGGCENSYLGKIIIFIMVL